MSFTCACSGVNAGKPPAPEQRVRFLLGPMEGSEEKELTLTATSVPTLTSHPLGKAHSSRGLGITSEETSARSQCPSQCSDSYCPRLVNGQSAYEILDQEVAIFPGKGQILSILGFVGSVLPL